MSLFVNQGFQLLGPIPIAEKTTLACNQSLGPSLYPSLILQAAVGKHGVTITTTSCPAKKSLVLFLRKA